jgi:hypothetical protein
MGEMMNKIILQLKDSSLRVGNQQTLAPPKDIRKMMRILQNFATPRRRIDTWTRQDH